nr:helix-hairpin-helix domain-containing protein [Pullulanibacillus pueri]
MVDIEGAVNAPGVYELRTGQRIVDAIKKAGGLSAHADKKRVNLAQKVVDEMMIYIPVEGETDVPASAQETTEPAEGEEAATKVNINTADLTKLQDIPGIGASKAAAILEYRKEHGAFKKIEDLVNVSGIGEKSLEKMKAVVTLN